MDVVKLSWSGGKDSTASLLTHLELGDVVKAVYYIPYLTPDIPLICKDHFDFISDFVHRFSDDVLFFQAHGINYYDFVHSVVSRGKNKGKYTGIGLGFGFCKFRDYSKRKALNSLDVGYYDYVDIGICSDEIHRLSQLNSFKRSILYDLRYIQDDCKKICVSYGVLSPIYAFGSRDGCAICPNAPSRLKRYISDYPQAKEILLDIENFCKIERPENYPYRSGLWFSDFM